MIFAIMMKGVDKMLYILAFICGFVVYRWGVKDGINIANGKKPESFIPKRKHEQENKLNKGWENILDVRNRHKRGVEKNETK